MNWTVLSFLIPIWLSVGFVVGSIWMFARRDDFALWEKVYLLTWIVVSWPVPVGFTLFQMWKDRRA